MKLHGLLFCIILAASHLAYAQTGTDSAFSLLINSGISFTHANDPHINRWLTKYGYPAESHVPASLNAEIAAIPVSSDLLYSLKLSTVISSHNLSSFNILGGLYKALVKKEGFLLFAGMGAGFHKDIVVLNGDMPADYKTLAARYNRQLALHRAGLFIEPALRAYWFPVTIHNMQIGLFAGLGFDMDFNSRWRLGYYDNNHGKYDHFKNIKKPADQQRVSEYGLSYNAGLSLHLHLL